MELDTSKNAMQNLSAIYDELKAAKAKRMRILAEMEKTNAELEREQGREGKSKSPQKTNSRSKNSKGRKSGWASAYRPFETSGSLIAVSGKNAKQNDELYAKHLEDEDLFFHADIQGAPATILKKGKSAGQKDLLECAQWAASFSSAWKTGAAAVDVYALEKSQVSKRSPKGEYGGKGAFFLTGKRRWFRKTELKLKIGKSGGLVEILPAIHSKKLEKSVEITPGGEEKEAAATKLSARLSCKKDEIIPLLPNGGFSLSI